MIPQKPGLYRRHHYTSLSNPAKVLPNLKSPPPVKLLGSESLSSSTMLPLARPAMSGALCGMDLSIFRSIVDCSLIEAAARPRLALLPRAQPMAALSTSTVKSATALERQSPSGQTLTASGKVRKEVALPSQEKKEGAMQYVLFVFLLSFVPRSPLTSLQDYP
jgi:hypothetical protein